jgi:hypothetical protein
MLERRKENLQTSLVDIASNEPSLYTEPYFHIMIYYRRDACLPRGKVGPNSHYLLSEPYSVNDIRPDR